MDKNIEMVMLYEIYGKLLTSKQQDIFEEYYLYNLSLREIAENKKISYQAVRDSIKSSENMLNNFEDIIGMKKMVSGIEKALLILENDENVDIKRDKLIKILKNTK